MNSADLKYETPLMQGRNSCLLAFLLFFVAELVAVFLAGGPRQGGMGIFLAVAGVILIFFPLQRLVSWWLWPLALILILAVSSSLLPVEFFGVPPWREFLATLPALHLTHLVTMDPLATVFWIGMLTASLSIAIYCLTLPLSSRAMERVALLAVLGCSIYAVVAWIAWETGWHYPFFVLEPWAQPAYGFFVNRNQTAGFLLTGAILSLGLIHRGMNGGSLSVGMISGMACALLVAILLFLSQSRGGLIFLIAGVVIWMAGLGKYRSRLLILGCAGLFVFLAILFLRSGSGLLERFTGPEARATTSPEVPRNPRVHDQRIEIALDTARMIQDQPLAGSGLGTYAEVYPFYADRSLHYKMMALHAESDWLTLAAEAGLPAFLIVFAGIALLAVRIPKLRVVSGQHWPVRWAFLSAFFAEFLHSFVDVPFHKPELGWWLLLLGAVGFGFGGDGGRVGEKRRALLGVQRVLFIICGIAISFLGLQMIRGQWFHGESLPPFAVAAAQKRLIETYGEGDDESVKRAAGELSVVIGRYPMAHSLYFQFGNLLLNMQEPSKEAKDLFAVERALLPNDSIVVFEQGKLLLPSSPDATVELWRESLRRQLKLDCSPDRPIARTPELFGQMIQLSSSDPYLLGKIPEIAAMAPELRMIWLRSQQCDPGMIAAAVQEAAFMNQLSPKDQGRLLELWWQRGDRNAVVPFMETHPEYTVSGVITRASILVASGQPEQACRLLIKTFGIPMPVKAIGSKTIQAAEGEVPSESLAAAHYYLEHGNVVAARHLLDAAAKDEKSATAQADILLLRAQLEMSAENWTDAFRQLTAYLRASGRI